jgi:hypothetical protein
VGLLLVNLIDSNQGSDSYAVPPLTPPLLGVLWLLPLVPEPYAPALGFADVSASPWMMPAAGFLHVNGHKCFFFWAITQQLY